MTPSRPKSRLAPAMIVAAVLLLPIAYVLSIGPAYRLAATGRLDQATFSTVYAPVKLAYDQSNWLHDAVNWYAHLWHDPDRLNALP